MEQTKAIILHQPKTATVPGHSVITIVHMLLASCLHCFAFFFFFNLKESTSIRLLRNPSHSLSLYFFFFFYHTHIRRERKDSEGICGSRSVKDQTFFTPYQFGKSVRSKWFPKPQVIRLCLSPWHRLQDSKIKRARSSSEMSSNRLNSNAVIKYSSVDVSARVPAKKTTRSEFLLPLADATHGETLAPPIDCD